MPPSPTRALVLGAGGVVGIAWEVGILAGLADAGVEVLDADTVIGTSAGATVAAQITGSTSLAELHAQQLDAASNAEPVVDVDMADVRRRLDGILTRDGDADDLLREVGALALAADRVPESERLDVIAGRLADDDWPARQLRLTAIDAESGRLVVFDASSGVALVDAVAASCAIPIVWPATTISGRRYMDGGMRSFTNIDVADDHERALVLEPLRSVVRRDLASGPQCVESLLVTADDDSLAAMGANPLDPSARAASARAGFAQGHTIAVEVASFWRRDG